MTIPLQMFLGKRCRVRLGMNFAAARVRPSGASLSGGSTPRQPPDLPKASGAGRRDQIRATSELNASQPNSVHQTRTSPPITRSPTRTITNPSLSLPVISLTPPTLAEPLILVGGAGHRSRVIYVTVACRHYGFSHGSA